jgi:hypothetical protein
MHRVQVRINAPMDGLWSEWLEGLTIQHVGDDETLLTGTIAQQSTLFGLLCKMRDLDVPIAALHAIEEAAPG